ncbi:integrase, catalytic region domain protein [Burkholderia pseudomallei ABCPW 107]|nr:integrase, catalytic region domain protein [Burkholderia pseudomallei ABCPW 107]
MWPRPVVVELPLFDSQVDCLLCRGMVGPKLVPVSKLRTFNLAIEVWRAWWNWPEFDALVLVGQRDGGAVVSPSCS